MKLQKILCISFIFFSITYPQKAKLPFTETARHKQLKIALSQRYTFEQEEVIEECTQQLNLFDVLYILAYIGKEDAAEAIFNTAKEYNKAALSEHEKEKIIQRLQTSGNSSLTNRTSEFIENYTPDFSVKINVPPLIIESESPKDYPFHLTEKHKAFIRAAKNHIKNDVDLGNCFNCYTLTRSDISPFEALYIVKHSNNKDAVELIHKLLLICYPGLTFTHEQKAVLRSLEEDDELTQEEDDNLRHIPVKKAEINKSWCTFL
jgi:hypothetical protein